jgi:soluble lytic murein transglycosylase-like protein
VRLAQQKGYTPRIVEVMTDHGLPPQFSHLALQESDFEVRAVGPPTRWGRAKGMWRFIPRTALQYGLDPGVYGDSQRIDPQDERHDFEKSTAAAARYLRTIYATLAHASGLLVVASYNWGEHRVAPKLGELELSGPQAVPASAFEGIPETAEARSYWLFLGEFRERMLEEPRTTCCRSSRRR